MIYASKNFEFHILFLHFYVYISMRLTSYFLVCMFMTLLLYCRKYATWGMRLGKNRERVYM